MIDILQSSGRVVINIVQEYFSRSNSQAAEEDASELCVSLDDVEDASKARRRGRIINLRCG